MRRFVLISLFALLTATAVSAQDAQPKIGDYSLETQGDSLIVKFTAELPAAFLPSRMTYVMTPVITTWKGETALPALSVEGRHYYLVAADRDAQAVRVRYTRDTMTVHYRHAIPATAALRRAGLRMDAAYRTLCPCDKGHAATSTTLSDAGADLSPFAGKTQILYYIPAPYTESCESVDDFGGKSVFPLGSVAMDQQIFDPNMQKVLAEYRRMKEDTTIRIRLIEVCVWSSPDGKYAFNERLADTRAENIRTHIREHLGDADFSVVKVTAQAENWEAFNQALPAADIRDKAAIERILARQADPDLREEELRELPEWPAIYCIFNESRNCRIVTRYDKENRHAHSCPVDEQGLVETRLNAPAGYITAAEAERIVSMDTAVPHLNNRMVAALESGDYDKALEYAERISDENLCPAVANNKAVLYSLGEQREKAADYFRMATAVPAANYNQGVMLLNEGQEAEAAALLEPYMKNN